MKTTKRKRAATDGARPAAKARAATAPLRVVEAQEKPAPRDIRSASVALPGNCTVKDAAALKQTLCGVAQDSAMVTIDITALERIDTSTMQLLCAFVRDRVARKQPVAWHGTSQVLDEAARLLGVRELLACANDISGAGDRPGAAA